MRIVVQSYELQKKIMKLKGQKASFRKLQEWTRIPFFEKCSTALLRLEGEKREWGADSRRRGALFEDGEVTVKIIPCGT